MIIFTHVTDLRVLLRAAERGVGGVEGGEVAVARQEVRQRHHEQPQRGDRLHQSEPSIAASYPPITITAHYSMKRRLSEGSRRFHNHGEGP